MDKIIEYLNQKYTPVSIILYGSFANGTNNLNSDFDALVISSEHKQYHDTSFVNGVQLDVYVYPASHFDKDFSCDEFIQIHDGKIIKDSDGRGKLLQSKVLAHLQNRQQKSSEEIESSVNWCIKMLNRAKRNDTEGMFRWHWLLTDSLEIFCDIMQHPYFGPKKSLEWMKNEHPVCFEYYSKALNSLNINSLDDWISCIKKAHTTTPR